MSASPMAFGLTIRKAFATPWEVCFDLAYPPGWCMVLGVLSILNGRK